MVSLNPNICWCSLFDDSAPKFWKKKVNLILKVSLWVYNGNRLRMTPVALSLCGASFRQSPPAHIDGARKPRYRLFCALGTVCKDMSFFRNCTLDATLIRSAPATGAISQWQADFHLIDITLHRSIQPGNDSTSYLRLIEGKILSDSLVLLLKMPTYKINDFDTVTVSCVKKYWLLQKHDAHFQ